MINIVQVLLCSVMISVISKSVSVHSTVPSSKWLCILFSFVRKGLKETQEHQNIKVVPLTYIDEIDFSQYGKVKTSYQLKLDRYIFQYFLYFNLVKCLLFMYCRDQCHQSDMDCEM